MADEKSNFEHSKGSEKIECRISITSLISREGGGREGGSRSFFLWSMPSREFWKVIDLACDSRFGVQIGTKSQQKCWNLGPKIVPKPIQKLVGGDGREHPDGLGDPQWPTVLPPVPWAYIDQPSQQIIVQRINWECQMIMMIMGNCDDLCPWVAHRWMYSVRLRIRDGSWVPPSMMMWWLVGWCWWVVTGQWFLLMGRWKSPWIKDHLFPWSSL